MLNKQTNNLYKQSKTSPALPSSSVSQHISSPHHHNNVLPVFVVVTALYVYTLTNLHTFTHSHTLVFSPSLSVFHRLSLSRARAHTHRCYFRRMRRRCYIHRGDHDHDHDHDNDHNNDHDNDDIIIATRLHCTGHTLSYPIHSFVPAPRSSRRVLLANLHACIHSPPSCPVLCCSTIQRSAPGRRHSVSLVSRDRPVLCRPCSARPITHP